MFYSQAYKTKWHDTDADGVMRPSAMLMYMQETANLQCRDWNCDLDRLHKEEGLGFLLSRMMLRVDAPLFAYDNIEVRTWCPPSRGLTFLRCFSILRDGEVIATALSHWALMDLFSRKLVRVSDFPRPFPIDEAPDETRLPRRVHMPATIAAVPVGERRIVYSDLDFNHHMNNTKYPDMLCDHLPAMAGKWVRTLSLSYLREAAYGDTLTITHTPAEAPAMPDVSETHLIRAIRGDGTVCAEAEIGLCPVLS